MSDLAPVCLPDLGWSPLQAPPLDAITVAFWHTEEVEPIQAEYLCLPLSLLQKLFPQDLCADLSTVFSPDHVHEHFIQSQFCENKGVLCPQSSFGDLAGIPVSSWPSPVFTWQECSGILF